MPERLQKLLARHGLGSRREIERWIAEGRVTVNLKPARLGDVFRDGDRIAIDGKEVTARLSIEVAPQVLIFHKAQGQPIALDERRKPIEAGDPAEQVEHPADTLEPVMERLPSVRGSRWVPINPMHAGDNGLLLLTNDGNLGYALTRRKRWIKTAYMVRVLSPGAAENESRVAPEIPLQVTYDSGHGNETIEFASVEAIGGEGANLWYRVELERADHRAAVRALFESRRMKVSRMTQVLFGPIELPRDLARNRHRQLTEGEVAALYELAQIPVQAAPKPQAPRNIARKRVAPDRRRAPKKKPLRGDIAEAKPAPRHNKNQKKISRGGAEARRQKQKPFRSRRDSI